MATTDQKRQKQTESEIGFEITEPAAVMRALCTPDPMLINAWVLLKGGTYLGDEDEVTDSGIRIFRKKAARE